MEHITYCRICPATCGLVVTVDDGRITKVIGDNDNPLTRGFTCTKGRHIGDFVQDPNRFRWSQRQVAPGQYEDVSPLIAIEEVAARLQDIVDEHGPHAVAMYSGTQAAMSSLTNPFGNAFWRSLGSRSTYSSMTVDQSAKWVAEARLGKWAAGHERFADSDVWMLVGTNPLVSMQGGVFTGFPIHDGQRRLQQEKRRGLKLVVVDPRRTEVATYADVHLQLIPGTDAVLFAGLVHLLIEGGHADAEFCARWVDGFDDLRAAVAAYPPELVASVCGVPLDDLLAVARIFGGARKGAVMSGTGPDMSPRANLAEHLIQVVNVVCGRFPRAGDALASAAVLGSAKGLPAQVVGPDRTWESGYQSRFGYGMLMGQLPTPLLADEILEPGPDQIRALIVSGANPASAVPDQAKMVRALSSLDLLVTIDPFPSETARLAHYVIAPVIHLERPDTTRSYEGLMDLPFAQTTEAVVPAPEGTMDDWEVFVRLAWAMGHGLKVGGRDYPVGSEMPTTAEVLASFAGRARVPLTEVAAQPHGALYPDLEPPRAVEALPDATDRFAVAPPDVVAELAELHLTMDALTAGRPLRLVVRRAKEVINSLERRVPSLTRQAWNPCFVHPSDLAEIGVADGDVVTITSDDGVIKAVARADATMRPGVVSMTHAFGDLPGEDDDPREFGASTNRLISVERDLQPISAMPRMSAVPVTLAPV